ASAGVAGHRQDGKIIGLVSAGHFMSHFYFLTLPPLFPVLREAFGVSYTELGIMMTAIYGTSAVAQVPVGFAVDRYGARLVLGAGLTLMAAAFGLIGLAPGFIAVGLLGMLGAIGHSVFHPADYAILGSSIAESRMARAFSIHTFAGHLGTAMAPATIIFLAALANWRGALVAAGLIGLVVMVALSTQWSSLSDDVLPPTKAKKKADDAAPAESPIAGAPAKDGLALLFSRPIVLFFLFFAVLSMTSSGMQAFSVAALVSLHDMPVAAASAGLTAYLFCTAGGILLGGEISGRTGKHHVIAAIAFVVTAAIALVLAQVHLALFALIPLMVVMGLSQGIIRPARDMMLRAAAPKGSTGKVFGFVSAGIATGSAVAPIPFGLLLDAGRPEWVFYLIVGFMMIALATLALQMRERRVGGIKRLSRSKKADAAPPAP
ncbi:MAG TPA: MFS transporter, partial [Afifellaceae bacterium]|nr:MFS transporter [Afifellaceae bacterium]